MLPLILTLLLQQRQEADGIALGAEEEASSLFGRGRSFEEGKSM